MGARSPSLTDEDIARWRLRNQSLVAPLHRDAAAVVHSLLAVQAENVGQTAWAIAARTERADPTDLAGRLATGAVVRTHVLRPTWHYVAADDIGWLLHLTGARVQRVTGRQLRADHGIDDAAIDRARTVVADTLADRPVLTRADLAPELVARGVVPPGGVPGVAVMVLLLHLELDGLICSGPPTPTGEHTYALFAQRVPATRRLDRDEALGQLARRYLAGHGPATERDLAYWATLALGDVRRGLAVAGPDVAHFDHDGRVYWHLAGDGPPTAPGVPRAHLLQILDEMYRGYQDSRWVLDAAGVALRDGQRVLGMALLDGQLVATVRRAAGTTTIRFDVTPYRPLHRAEVEALRDAARRYGEFAGARVVLVS